MSSQIPDSQAHATAPAPSRFESSMSKSVAAVESSFAEACDVHTQHGGASEAFAEACAVHAQKASYATGYTRTCMVSTTRCAEGAPWFYYRQKRAARDATQRPHCPRTHVRARAREGACGGAGCRVRNERRHRGWRARPRHTTSHVALGRKRLTKASPHRGRDSQAVVQCRRLLLLQHGHADNCSRGHRE